MGDTRVNDWNEMNKSDSDEQEKVASFFQEK